MKAPRLIVALSLVLACSVSNANPPEGWSFGRLDQALVAAQQQDKPVFLYFGRHGCPTCERVNNETFTDPRVVEAFQSAYVLAYVDSESGRRLRLSNGERITEMELGVKLNIFGTPFFYITEPNGKPILRAPGYQSVDDFMLYHEFVNGGHYKSMSLAEFKESRS